MSIVFLGGLLLPSKLEEIAADSRFYVENAANSLQKGFMSGLKAQRLVNLPFIGSFPQAYRRPVFWGSRKLSFKDVDVYEPSFINVRFIRIASRLLAAFVGLCRFSVKDCDIVVYSAYLPFLGAAVLYRSLFRRTNIYLILPDFIEHMGEVSHWRRIVLALETRIFRRLACHVTGFVLLTEAMAEKLGIASDRFVVVEGMIDPDINHDVAEVSASNTRIFLYSGTLDRRYGISDLLEAFASIRSSDVRLWICGSGNASRDVERAAAHDSRISYFGLVSQDAAREMQRKADILVNPRRPDGEFTKYSFPSKTIEYMAAGKPVVMHNLPGLPFDYLPYLQIPTSPDSSGLAKCMSDLAQARADELQGIGMRARDFVLTNKTPERQCERVLELIARSRR